MRRLQLLESDLFNTKGLQAIRKPRLRNQSLYRFSSRSSFTSHHLDAEDPQLPHYVVPVLYVPHRIITNHELIEHDTYENALENFSCEQILCKKRSISPSYSIGRKECGSERLTDSETEIYERLMETMYGIKSPEEIDYYKGDYKNLNELRLHRNQISDYENIIRRNLIGSELDCVSQNHDLSVDPDISSVCMKTFSKQTPIRLGGSFISPIYSARSLEVPLFSPSIYSIRSVKPENSDLCKPTRDDKSTITELPILISRTINNFNVSQRRSLIMAYDSVSVTSGEEGPETKYTQTKVDTTVSTQTSESKVSKQIQEILSKDHKSAELGENIEAVVSSTTDCSDTENLFQKCNKSNESLPTVDLLPVASSTFQRLNTVEENTLEIPKLGVHTEIWECSSHSS